MDELRDLYLKSIYWLLWKSADFEADFAETLPSTYENMKLGNEREISTTILEIAFNYALVWVQAH